MQPTLWMRLMILALVLCSAGAKAEAGELADAGAPFGPQKLVDEIECGQPVDETLFTEFPNGVSRLESLLGKACRVLPQTGDTSKYFAYRIGKDKGLEAGKAYVLAIDFPDDQPRTVWIINNGCETARGFHTGKSSGDVVKGRHVNHNAESLNYPQTGAMQTWRQLFFLHDRFADIKRPRGLSERPFEPKDGFWVIFPQPEPLSLPMSQGTAVARIRLFEIDDPAKYNVPIQYPPEGLPRRHLFWREEMSDNVIGIGHKPEEKDPKLRGVTDRLAWYEYKAQLMQFLGMNTFSKDLLEFGANQGWDTSRYGGNAWCYQSSDPKLWENIIDRLAKYDLYFLPQYEYSGARGSDQSKAIGSARRCLTLSGAREYTHVTWCNKSNADILDPDIYEDLRRMLELTIVDHKDKVKFLGAWLRPRPEGMPISFNEMNLALFAKEANDGQAVMREQLQQDKALYGKYIDWWYTKRRDFLHRLSQYLREQGVNDEAIVMMTNDASEPGISALDGIVTDDVPAWEKIFTSDQRFSRMSAVSFDDIVRDRRFSKSLTSPRGTWGKWEWQHGTPRNDPENYKEHEGVLMSYTFNRNYTAQDSDAFEQFRSPSGLAVVRHYTLNENEMHIGKESPVGYFVMDVERAGPFCMMGEALCMANGDPRYIGYLVGNSFSRGFPDYARDFNAAFLALPALPSSRLAQASSEQDVVVRQIPAGEHGTYFAIVNTAFVEKKAEITLPVTGTVTNAATGETLKAEGGKLFLTMYPAQLVALRVR